MIIKLPKGTIIKDFIEGTNKNKITDEMLEKCKKASKLFKKK